ncbi:MAG: glycosyl transferase family 28 [Phaeodactylibacter sp.]|nr:glycosyl transferase family 28 [Phaeodactylibacter sp.]
MAAAPRILVAPLDWGLGHATRCVPIIEEIRRQGGAVAVGAAGGALAYLKAEFPGLEFVNLPAYNIRYYWENMFWNIGVQAPGLLRAIWREHRQVQQVIRRLNIDAVISDSRFGCFSPHIPSIFVTHQLHIQIPSPPLQGLANRLNHWFIRQYGECWIPDVPGPGSLSGTLSFPWNPAGESGPSGKIRHIGILSRLQPEEGEKEYDILALLSGPEPQRSRLESALIGQLSALPYRVLLAQGLPGREKRCRPAPHIEVVSFLNARELRHALGRSALVICRPGYSTAMDMAAMGKKALFIPTPGQTEQEYLARRLQRLGYCPCQNQNELDVKKGVLDAGSYAGFPKYDREEARLIAAVKSLMGRIAPWPG